MAQIFGQQRGSGGLFLGGSKVSDQDIRDQMGRKDTVVIWFLTVFFSACNPVNRKCRKILPWPRRPRQNACRRYWCTCSLPHSVCTMTYDDGQDVTVTNDGATILSLLDVEHPAGRILIELAQQQDKEVGDGTTSVVIIAAELLRRANELVKNRIHPTTIITGYRLALREATKYLQEALSTKVENLGKGALQNVAKTSMSSKVIGRFARLSCSGD